MRRVCVFCGSSSGTQPVYAEAARATGHALASRGMDLIYGGGNVGLMGILADAALEKGGRVYGVIPQALLAKELGHSGLTKLHVVQTMHQRKATMANLSDGFVAIPGGFGTAEEFFEIVTWAQLGIHAKPIGLFNVAGYFDPLLAWVNSAVEEGFIRQSHRDLILTATGVDELLDRMASRPPAEPVEKWVRPDEG